jgi:hypothetical protein
MFSAPRGVVAEHFTDWYKRQRTNGPTQLGFLISCADCMMDYVQELVGHEMSIEWANNHLDKTIGVWWVPNHHNGFGEMVVSNDDVPLNMVPLHLNERFRTYPEFAAFHYFTPQSAVDLLAQIDDPERIPW